MSQKVTRNGRVSVEEREKRQTNSPVKEMKKKMAANAEKEKLAAAEKQAEKAVDKKTENVVEKKTAEKTEKQPEKQAEKKADKSNDKKDGEKAKDDSKGEKSGKADKDQKKDAKPKQNGKEKTHNGVSDVTLAPNGNDEVLNGTVGGDSDDDDVMLVIDDQDELFPELTYDDTSDVECFEPPTPENGPSRSFTRRSQVKVTRTPETPRPASEKQPEKEASSDDSKEPKNNKQKEEPQSDRKLRSADSPKPEGKKAQDSPKNVENKAEKVDSKVEKAKAKADENKQDTENGDDAIEVVVTNDVVQDSRKPDTNYSKSRVKVSPYRRLTKLADQTTSSVMANYTGNNTTMEMDITETSSFVSEEPSLDDSWSSKSLQMIRGRRSYKTLKELKLPIINRSAMSPISTSVMIDQPSIPTELPARPTGTVVGRKRKPDDVEEAFEADVLLNAHGKRMRLLDKLAHPFRRHVPSTPLPRRAAEIVGINTDLPLTAPVATTSSVDPEVIKPIPMSTPEDKDHKRCVVM